MITHVHEICQKHLPIADCCKCSELKDCGFYSITEARSENIIQKTKEQVATTCPLTNSSHEKALVRVVEKDSPLESNECWVKDFIQVLCSCGHIISEAKIKNK